MQMNGEWLGKRAMRINQANNAKPLEEGGALDMGDPSNCTVYIGGVVAGTSE